MNNYPEVIDNFLPEDVFLSIQDVLMGKNFPWFYDDRTVYDVITDKFDYQFVHSFFKMNERYGFLEKCSSFCDIILPIIEKLDCFCLLRVKSNLRTLYKDQQINQSIYYHRDLDEDCTTAIFYINTNNGYTIFKDNQQKVDCVANRLVKFDTKLEHAGVSSNNEKQRVVINFNYI
tara:strand:+ start:62 stop:586 length:525 start_codon:yes stop_codon:yes gene_type:complete